MPLLYRRSAAVLAMRYRLGHTTYMPITNEGRCARYSTRSLAAIPFSLLLHGSAVPIPLFRTKLLHSAKHRARLIILRGLQNCTSQNFGK